METHSSLIGSLAERAEQYAKCSFELYRLKAIDRSADIVSSLVTKVTILSFFMLFFLVLNIGIALWVGDLMGKSYFGFMSIASFYAIVCAIIYMFRNKWIKVPVRNAIIINTLNLKP